MIKILKIGIGIVLLYSFLNAEELEIQILGQRNSFDKKLGYKDAYGFGLRENIFFTRYNALQLSLDKLNNVSKGLPIVRYSANYMFRYRDTHRILEPFFMIGAGGQKGLGKKKGFMNFGIGSNLKINKELSLVAEVKGISKDDNTLDISANLGIGFFPKFRSVKKIVKHDNIPEKYAIKLKKTQSTPVKVKPQIITPKPVKIFVKPSTYQSNNYTINDDLVCYDDIDIANYKDLKTNKIDDIIVFDDEK